MQEQDDLFADAARQLLQGECTPARVRAIEAGGSPRALWESLEQAGFADALVPEDAGGAGLALAQLFDVWSLAGAHALPVPLGETMLARALLAGAGVERPQAAIALAEGLLQPDGSLHCAPVRLGAVAGSVLVQHGQGWSLLPVAQAQPEKAAFCLDVNLRWSAGQVRAAPSLGIALPDGLDLRTLQACLVAAQLAGALMEVFQRTLQYANDRQQFGRPIGKFQIIQHELAQISEHAFSSRMAAQIACESDSLAPDALRVAVGKARTSEAVVVVADFSHSIHGAIGFTEEFDLQLFTRRLHHWRATAGSEGYWHEQAGEALLADTAPLALDLIRRVSDAKAVA
jgi:acyl-CoA dehydrogenase